MATTDSPGSSKNGKDGGDEKEENPMFECNICLDTAKDAVVSMCGHLFCWPCLHQWLETRPSRQLCPVCKAAIGKDKVIPLYGRGSTQQEDPRNKVPPRPAGQRIEPENTTGFPGFGFGDGGFHMSFGIGAFPFGFLTSTFIHPDQRASQGDDGNAENIIGGIQHTADFAEDFGGSTESSSSDDDCNNEGDDGTAENIFGGIQRTEDIAEDFGGSSESSSSDDHDNEYGDHYYPDGGDQTDDEDEDDCGLEYDDQTDDGDHDYDDHTDGDDQNDNHYGHNAQIDDDDDDDDDDQTDDDDDSDNGTANEDEDNSDDISEEGEGPNHLVTVEMNSINDSDILDEGEDEEVYIYDTDEDILDDSNSEYILYTSDEDE